MRRRLGLRPSLALLCLSGLPWADAGEIGASFSLAVRVQQPPPEATTRADSGICGSSSTRSIVSIGCPGQGPATPLRVMAFTNRETQVSTLDVYTGGARILGWQVLSLDDREYLEMTLGW